MGFIAGIAVDRRQDFILSSDRLREMLGASRLIDNTVDRAEASAQHHNVDVIRPVSGEIWVRAEKVEQLQAYLLKLRDDLVSDKQMDVTFAVIQEPANPDHTPEAIERALAIEKRNRSFEDGRPSSPLFARCHVLPHLPPNIWRPENARSRRLISDSADIRNRSITTDGPLEMRQFAEREENSYAAFIKADVDGLGKIQQEMAGKWSTFAQYCSRQGPYCAIRDFSEGIQNSVRDAVTHSTNKCRGGKIEPIIQAGDDLWVIATRQHAFQFVTECAAKFTELCGQSPIISAVAKAVAEAAQAKSGGAESAGVESAEGKRLTLSFGILFAKVGFPLNRQVELADELLRNAKKYRREHKPNETCIDYFWLDSAGSGGVGAARQSAGYTLDATDYYLYSRPWTLEQTNAFLKSAEGLGKAVDDNKFAARKLHQVAPILRMGGEFTKIEMAAWHDSLSSGEKRLFGKALGELPEDLRLTEEKIASTGYLPAGPWLDKPDSDAKYTPLQEVLELIEITAQGGEQ